MIDYKIYVNPRDEYCITMIELKNKRLLRIYEITYYPLFKEIECRTLGYPTKQQLHSKRYYITKKQILKCTLNNSNFQSALEKTKELFKITSIYAHNLI